MPGLGEWIVILMILVTTSAWIWTIGEVAAKESGYQRLAWLLVVILASMIGALIYLIVRRPKRIALSRPGG